MIGRCPKSCDISINLLFSQFGGSIVDYRSAYTKVPHQVFSIIKHYYENIDFES